MFVGVSPVWEPFAASQKLLSHLRCPPVAGLGLIPLEWEPTALCSRRSSSLPASNFWVSTCLLLQGDKLPNQQRRWFLACFCQGAGGYTVIDIWQKKCRLNKEQGLLQASCARRSAKLKMIFRERIQILSSIPRNVHPSVRPCFLLPLFAHLDRLAGKGIDLASHQQGRGGGCGGVRLSLGGHLPGACLRLSAPTPHLKCRHGGHNYPEPHATCMRPTPPTALACQGEYPVKLQDGFIGDLHAERVTQKRQWHV